MNRQNFNKAYEGKRETSFLFLRIVYFDLLSDKKIFKFLKHNFKIIKVKVY